MKDDEEQQWNQLHEYEQNVLLAAARSPIVDADIGPAEFQVNLLVRLGLLEWGPVGCVPTVKGRWVAELGETRRAWAELSPSLLKHVGTVVEGCTIARALIPEDARRELVRLKLAVPLSDGDLGYTYLTERVLEYNQRQQ